MVEWVEVLSTDVKLLELGTQYQINPLVLEDCLHRDQRPKLDDYGTHQFVVWFMFAKGKLHEVQFIIFPDRLIVVPHAPPPSGTSWKEYLKVSDRNQDIWHMLYQALDHLTDITWVEMRSFVSEIDETEQKLFSKEINPQRLLKIKKILNQMDFTIGHLSSVAKQLQNICGKEGDLNWKLRDLHDHAERIYHSIELYRSQISTTIELYWGLQANRTNHQIKKMSILASVAVPLTFWCSFWGMNFEIIPFHSEKLFILALGAMALSVALAMWVIIKKGYWNN